MVQFNVEQDHSQPTPSCDESDEDEGAQLVTLPFGRPVETILGQVHGDKYKAH